MPGQAAGNLVSTSSGPPRRTPRSAPHARSPAQQRRRSAARGVPGGTAAHLSPGRQARNQIHDSLVVRGRRLRPALGLGRDHETSGRHARPCRPQCRSQHRPQRGAKHESRSTLRSPCALHAAAGASACRRAARARLQPPRRRASSDAARRSGARGARAHLALPAAASFSWHSLWSSSRRYCQLPATGAHTRGRPARSPQRGAEGPRFEVLTPGSPTQSCCAPDARAAPRWRPAARRRRRRCRRCVAACRIRCARVRVTRPAAQAVIDQLEAEAAQNWDKFYKVNADRFFKDRRVAQAGAAAKQRGVRCALRQIVRTPSRLAPRLRPPLAARCVAGTTWTRSSSSCGRQARGCLCGGCAAAADARRRRSRGRAPRGSHLRRGGLRRGKHRAAAAGAAPARHGVCVRLLAAVSALLHKMPGEMPA